MTWTPRIVGASPAINADGTVIEYALVFSDGRPKITCSDLSDLDAKFRNYALRAAHGSSGNLEAHVYRESKSSTVIQTTHGYRISDGQIWATPLDDWEHAPLELLDSGAPASGGNLLLAGRASH